MAKLLYSPQQLLNLLACKSQLIQNTDSDIRTILIDSRRINDPFYGLYFALTANRNGHQFIPDAYAQGVRNFVIADEEVLNSQFADANFFIVDDTLEALQSLAAFHRKQFNIPIVGITGSNGKTIVKEWLYQILHTDKNCVRSPKSYNSQIGVALSVWDISEEHELGIIEAGISKSGEMMQLEEMIKPGIGILTNIGNAHDSGFSSKHEKIREKLLLFDNCELVIYGTEYLADYTGQIPGKQHFSWGVKGSNLEIRSIAIADGNTTVQALFNDKVLNYSIPFIDHASIENSFSCLAYLLATGWDADKAVFSLGYLSPVGMRLELKKGINNCSVIDDSYSLDLSSLNIALDFLKQQNQHPVRTLILSDIPGEPGIEAYLQLAEMIRNKSVDRFIAVGERLSTHKAYFSESSVFYPDTESLLKDFEKLNFSNESILLKGARSFRFERLSQLLSQKVHGTVLEINLNAMQHNLNHFRSLLKKNTRIMAMVKALSYGSGSYEIANFLEFNKVNYLAVAYADEGVALRQHGCNLPIMVMSPDAMAFESIIEYKLEPELYNLRILTEFRNLLRERDIRDFPVHIKLDTGMHRLGFAEGDMNDLLEELSDSGEFRVMSVFSHLSSSSDPDMDSLTKNQITLFKSLSFQIQNLLSYPILLHIANTSAISRIPEAEFDMVRLGIGLYGIDPGNSKSALQTVTSLKTSITQLKQLKPGESIGYDAAGKMPEGGKIATVKIGYADGYSRLLGEGRGEMLIGKQRVLTIGKICMDMCMLDVSKMEVSEGDEVIVFNSELRVEELAKKMNTIPYEVLTGISDRVKRVYYYE